MVNRSNTIDFFSVYNELSFQQDTVKNQPDSINHTVVNTNETEQQDSVPVKTFQQIDLSAIDSILRLSEERERQIREEAERQAAIQRWRQRKIDTTEILYKQFGIANFPIEENIYDDAFNQNFLYNIPSVKPIEKQVKQTVFIEEGTGANTENETGYKTTISTRIEPKYIPKRIQFDWITIVLIASFLLLGWIRLFNKKYLVSLVKSIISYKEANTLYREKNSLMERASFMVNILFLSNISVFVIQLKLFWQLDLGWIENWALYLIVFCSLLGLYILRAITTSFIGYVFLKQRVFSEYFHNVNIYTKNTGLFLFPVVIALQFLSYQYLSLIVYLGLSFCTLLYFLQVIRSFQIINRKNVSIFYMILYLCAFEFAPFLIIYKILLSLA